MFGESPAPRPTVWLKKDPAGDLLLDWALQRGLSEVYVGIDPKAHGGRGDGPGWMLHGPDLSPGE